MRSLGTSAPARLMVSTINGSLVPRRRSCLGRSGVLAGQKREPIPPARMVTQVWGSGVAQDVFDSSNELLRAKGLRNKVVHTFG